MVRDWARVFIRAMEALACCLLPPGRLVTVLMPGIYASPVNRASPISHVMQLGL